MINRNSKSLGLGPKILCFCNDVYTADDDGPDYSSAVEQSGIQPGTFRPFDIVIAYMSLHFGWLIPQGKVWYAGKIYSGAV